MGVSRAGFVAGNSWRKSTFITQSNSWLHHTQTGTKPSRAFLCVYVCGHVPLMKNPADTCEAFVELYLISLTQFLKIYLEKSPLKGIHQKNYGSCFWLVSDGAYSTAVILILLSRLGELLTWNKYMHIGGPQMHISKSIPENKKEKQTGKIGSTLSEILLEDVRKLQWTF